MNFSVLDIGAQYVLPLHSASLGSGSHSPFPIHVDVLGPVSTSPTGQSKKMRVPSKAGSL